MIIIHATRTRAVPYAKLKYQAPNVRLERTAYGTVGVIQRSGTRTVPDSLNEA